MARTLHEFCAHWNISLKKARRMNKDGDLRLSGEETEIDTIRLTLKTGSRRLSVAQLVYLLNNAGGALELGKYASLANAQIEALGDAKAEAAPTDVAVQILEAYENDADAVGIIAAWVASILPNKPVGHAYVAARLLLGVPENIRQFDVPRLQRVLMNCRSHPALAGHWKTVKQASRNVTFYQKQVLDL